MKSRFGRNFSATVFGGSHEPCIGVILDDFPPGFFENFSVDIDFMKAMLRRRAPGNSPWTTSRKEPDLPEQTDSHPLTYIIKNTNTRPSDYEELKDIPRPGHADYTGKIKYKDAVSLSGGGPFSGRMTAPLVIAGAIALQWLKEKRGIHISSDLDSIKGRSGDEAFSLVRQAKEKGDSVGGIITVKAKNCPPGIGGAMYQGLESYIAPIVFGIPGVKGLSFGDGFESTRRWGSENNDAFFMEQGKVVTKTNHCGGILGGITNGMEVVAHVGIKPTPSIALPQDSVRLSRGEQVSLRIQGRHDPCIVLRAFPVVESAFALGLLDALLEDAVPEK